MIKLTHDGPIDIAIGRGRNETSWKNEEWQWSDFLQRISQTEYTHETHEEYMALPKGRQDEIKDVGAYVGGFLVNGKRDKHGSVLHRSIITIDMDYGRACAWDDFTMLYGFAAARYSTHKHTPATPRMRLVFPLDRVVGSDEYEAIGRRIAADLDIELFDDTGFQPYRLMYWPSTSKGAEFEFDYQDGAWLCADDVLARYRDWKDASSWPISKKVDRKISSEMKKQGDPLEKKGVIGAFCRTYGIADAIGTFLSDAYEACDVDHRYTYTQGSTAAGAIAYENKFLYSFHGTDPISNKLCNAFDLVRIHLYGDMDENAKADTPIHKMPSFLAMCELATADKGVKIALGVERLKALEDDFPDMDFDNAEEVDWLGTLDVEKKTGVIKSTIENVKIILANDPSLKGKLAYDAFQKRDVALGPLPWRKVVKEMETLGDLDDAGLRHHIEKIYGISSTSKVKDGMDLVVRENQVHPIKKYLESAVWDREERLERLFIDYLGAEDSLYTHTVTRKTIVAAVARIFNPGCKFDNVLTLIGEEGRNKSTIWSVLAGKWFNDSFSFGMVHSKEGPEQIQGSWIIEVPELTGIRKTEAEGIKAFLSRRDDKYRAAFGRRVETYDRQCIFVGTTNVSDFLQSPNGNRRFWPVTIGITEPFGDVWKMTPETVKQIWAEAVALYQAGETLHLDKEVEALARAIQKEHIEEDDRRGTVEKFLDTLLPENWDTYDMYMRRNWYHNSDDNKAVGVRKRVQVCVAEIWCECLRMDPREMNSYNTKPVHAMLKNTPGWIPAKGLRQSGIYGKQKYYIVPNEAEFTGNGTR